MSGTAVIEAVEAVRPDSEGRERDQHDFETRERGQHYSYYVSFVFANGLTFLCCATPVSYNEHEQDVDQPRLTALT